METQLRNNFRPIGGPEIFSDQLAASIRDEFRGFMWLKYSVEKAENLLIDFFENAEGDDYDRAIGYIALALTEWNAGLLSERIKCKALSLLEIDVLLKPWKEACLVPKDERNGFFNCLFSNSFDLFYCGFSYEQSDADRKAVNENDLKDIITLIGGLEENENINIKPTKWNYSKNVASILFLDKSPEKKYKNQMDILEKYKKQLLSPMPAVKKYPKPSNFSTEVYNDFELGEIVLFKIPDGKYKDYWFAAEFLSKRQNNIFMSTFDVGVSYTNYCAFFDYFSTEKPSVETLKYKDFKALKITKKQDVLYYIYLAEFDFSQKTLEKYFIEKTFDESYTKLFQMKEASYVSARRAENHFTLGNDDILAKYLKNETEFINDDITDKEDFFDKKPEPPILEYNDKELTYETLVQLEDTVFFSLISGNTLNGKADLTFKDIDNLLAGKDCIDKIMIVSFKQNLFDYFIKMYGDRVKCLKLFRCNLCKDFSALSQLNNLV